MLKLLAVVLLCTSGLVHGHRVPSGPNAQAYHHAPAATLRPGMHAPGTLFGPTGLGPAHVPGTLFGPGGHGPTHVPGTLFGPNGSGPAHAPGMPYGPDGPMRIYRR